MRRTGFASTALTCLSLLGLMGCSASHATNAPSVAASPLPSVARTAEPTVAATVVPSQATSGVETLTETFDASNFGDPITVDNLWLPLQPGTRWTWKGSATIDGERVDRQIVTTITDLTKVLNGVKTVVAYDESTTAGQLDEIELAFFAQADDGLVWHFGEYPEEWEDGKFVEAPLWLAGLEDAKAGIVMQADPHLATLSYSQGWGPKVGWTDRARVFETGSQTCVPFACYKDVLVIDEFNRDSPDAHQLKYFAPGVGNVRVGWAGALEPEQETLELVGLAHLDAAALAEIRATALALEAHALVVSPTVYGLTVPAEPRP